VAGVEVAQAPQELLGQQIKVSQVATGEAIPSLVAVVELLPSG